MGVAEGVPEHDIGVFDWTVVPGPLFQPIAASALVWIVSCGVLLFRLVWRNPHMMIHKAGTLAPPRTGRRKGKCVISGEEFVAHGLAQRILD